MGGVRTWVDSRRGLVTVTVLIYLVLRLITGVMIWRASGDQVPFLPWTDEDPGYFDMAVLWDGTWYRQIAENGYPATLPVGPNGLTQQNAWAFYPLFPFLSAALMAITGLSFPVIGSTLALVAGAAAAAVMAMVLARMTTPWAAVAAVTVWAAFPASPSLQIAYTESLAMLLLVCWMWAVLRRSWWTVAILSLVIGVTRPIAAPLGIVVLVALVLRWRARTTRPIARAEWVAMGGATVLTGLSALVWPSIAALATGQSDAYTDTMASWRAGHVIVPLKPWLNMSRYVFRDYESAAVLGPVALVVIVVLLLVAVLGPWARGIALELRAWMLAYPAYLGFVLDPITSIYRYLIPLFPLALILIGAGWKHRRPGLGTALLTGALVIAGVLGQIAWIWGLLVFHPPTDFPP